MLVFCILSIIPSRDLVGFQRTKKKTFWSSQFLYKIRNTIEGLNEGGSPWEDYRGQSSMLMEGNARG